MSRVEVELTCPDCGSPMVLRETKKYTHKNGDPRLFYGCSRFPLCKAAHGAHPDGRPLGTPADKETKAARMRAHDAFDAIWRERKLLSRGAAYRWLSLKMGYEAHMGDMDIEQCERVIELCEAFYPCDPAASDASAEAVSRAIAQKRKWKAARAKWSPEKRREKNRAKKQRQKANRAKLRAIEEQLNAG